MSKIKLTNDTIFNECKLHYKNPNAEYFLLKRKDLIFIKSKLNSTNIYKSIKTITTYSYIKYDINRYLFVNNFNDIKRISENIRKNEVPKETKKSALELVMLLEKL